MARVGRRWPGQLRRYPLHDMLYRNRIIEDTRPAPSAELVAALEGLLGCRLPDDYRQFLEVCNGGYAVYEINAPLGDGSSEPLSFCYLNSLTSPGTWRTLPFELTQARQEPEFPALKVVPIASSGGGSRLFLDLRADCRVVAFIEGLPAWTGRHQQDELVTVAGSFNDYLDALFISDDAIIDAITDFDRATDDPERLVKWFDTGDQNWRTTYREIWERHVLNRG
jgi:hypothetical protein